MPSEKTLENRLDNVYNDIMNSRNLIVEYGKDFHAVDMGALIQLATNLTAVNTRDHIIHCDNSIRMLTEVKNILRKEESRRHLQKHWMMLTKQPLRRWK